MPADQAFCERFQTLAPDEQQNTIRYLVRLSEENSPTFGRPRHECPYCHSTEHIRHGYRGNLQRYRCKGCGRTFTDNTGTYLQYIHKKEKLEEYKQLMFREYIPLREMCERIGISLVTAFDWRHKLLCGIKQNHRSFWGSTALDVVGLAYSRKGRPGLLHRKNQANGKRRSEDDQMVKVLMTIDHTGHQDLGVVRIGRMRRSDIQRKVGDRLDMECTLIPGANSGIASFARAFNRNKNKPDKHVQKQNSSKFSPMKQLGEDFTELVNIRFRGVATKYLQSYANWLEFMQGKPPGEWQKVKIPKNVRTWDIYANIEKIYRHFIEKHSPLRYDCPTKRVRKTAGIGLYLFDGKTYI